MAVHHTVDVLHGPAIGAELGTPQFKDLVIAFGASYKHNWPLIDAELLTKFEGLLGRLVWRRAVLQNELNIRFVWEADWNPQEPMTPAQRWALRAESLTSAPCDLSQVVAGPFKSRHHTV